MSAAAPGAFLTGPPLVHAAKRTRKAPSIGRPRGGVDRAVTSTHFLRVEPEPYRALTTGQQQAICVPKAEGVVVGDYLVLRECRGAGGARPAYTGAWLMRRVSSELVGEGIADSHAVYSFGARDDAEHALVSLRRQLLLAERQGVSADRYFRVTERKERARRELLRRSLARVERVVAAGEGSRAGACE